MPPLRNSFFGDLCLLSRASVAFEEVHKAAEASVDRRRADNSTFVCKNFNVALVQTF